MNPDVETARTSPEQILTSERSGRGIRDEAVWLAMVDQDPLQFPRIPEYRKTWNVCDLAVRKHPLNLIHVPERHREPELVELYLQAKRAKRDVPPTEEPDDASDDSDDEPLSSRKCRISGLKDESPSTRKRQNTVGSDSEEDEPLSTRKRQKTVDEEKKQPPRRLGNLHAALSDKTIKTFQSSSKVEVTEAMVNTAKRLARMQALAMDDGATAEERAHAQRIFDNYKKKAPGEILALLESLDDEEAMPGRAVVNILRGNETCNRKEAWFSMLAHGVCTQFVCAHYVPTRSTRGVYYGFYGDSNCAMVAAQTMVEVFNVVTQSATNHSWAQGFADTYYQLQKDMRSKMAAVDNGDRSVVLVEKKNALILEARKQLSLGPARAKQLKGHHSDVASYMAGQRAASSYMDTEGKKRALM